MIIKTLYQKRNRMKHFDLSRFETILMDITNTCNLKCPLCARTKLFQTKQETKYITIKDLEQILLRFPNVNRFELGQIMSEPTNHPNLYDIIKFLKGHNKSILLPTNGNFNNLNIFKALKLLDLGDEIIWSLDGLSQLTYSQYRVGGSYNKVIMNIKAAVQEINVIHNIQVIEFKHNLEELNNPFYGFKEFKQDFLDMYPYPNINIYRIPSCINVQTDGNIEPLWDKRKWIDIKNSFQNNKFEKVECSSFETKDIYIDPFGNIQLCGDYYTENGSSVNIYDTPEYIINSIREVLDQRTCTPICKAICSDKSKLKRKIYGIPTSSNTNSSMYTRS